MAYGKQDLRVVERRRMGRILHDFRLGYRSPPHRSSHVKPTDGRRSSPRARSNRGRGDPYRATASCHDQGQVSRKNISRQQHTPAVLRESLPFKVLSVMAWNIHRYISVELDYTMTESPRDQSPFVAWLQASRRVHRAHPRCKPTLRQHPAVSAMA